MECLWGCLFILAVLFVGYFVGKWLNSMSDRYGIPQPKDEDFPDIWVVPVDPRNLHR
jgi:hypothetical protein